MRRKIIFIAVTLILILLIAVVFIGVKNSQIEVFSGFSLNSTILDLSNKNLTSLPAEIGKHSEVRELILDNNIITGSLVAEVGKMVKLEKISAKNNKMTGLPAEIGSLVNLEKLDLSFNNITALPNELFNLNQSLEINLTGNPLQNSDLEKLYEQSNFTVKF